MGGLASIFGGKNDEDEEEAAEQQALERWRPETVANVQSAAKKRVHAAGSADDIGGSQESDGGSVASSVSRMDDGEEEKEATAATAGQTDDQMDKGSADGGSEEGDGSESEDEDMDAEAEAKAKKEDAKRKKKIIVRMEFEPLLSLHEPLSTVLEEPAELFASGKKKKKNKRMEEAAIEDANADYRVKAKAAAAWMTDVGLEDCLLGELAQAVGEEVDDMRFALEQSKRFSIDDDTVVRRTLVQRLLDIMESDIETVTEIIDKLGDATEAGIKMAVKDSLGELKIRTANDVELVERVDPEEELRTKREEEKIARTKEKDERKKEQQKRRRKKGQQQEEEDEDSDSSDDEGGLQGASDKKALAFRRVQVQRKIEEFLKAYTRGQNLVKINAKGRRYARRVYVDTAKRALVIQGANGPKFFPFASMREVDLETRTTKEGRVETLVICAIEKGGRIVKELTLAFPDQAKANAFVNCVTLFSLALRKSSS